MLAASEVVLSNLLFQLQCLAGCSCPSTAQACLFSRCFAKLLLHLLVPNNVCWHRVTREVSLDPFLNSKRASVVNSMLSRSFQQSRAHDLQQAGMAPRPA
ncbi:hypothetical protein ABPG77_000636 [Micractinium sp. CCAP 211/92]